MRYRIKVITYRNNRQEFVAQVKRTFGWGNIDHEGKYSRYTDGICYNREKAINRIDMHVTSPIFAKHLLSAVLI